MSLATLAAGLVIMTAAPASATTAWEVTNPNGFTNGSWAFGEIFTVGPDNLTVTGLGALDIGGNGFVTSGGIQVGLFDELTSSLLASGIVLSTDQLTGNYRFTSITPLNLISGSQYRVVAVSGQDLYNVTTNTPNVVNSAITWDRYAYCSSSTLQSCDQFTGTERTWMANLTFQSAGAVPEPGTWITMLLGFGFVGGAIRAAKRRQKITISYA